mgnify:FL=1|jgi:hypothetical protein|tara:strand:- start:15015 stop:15386 length:372 start_codon:yes stop_codon:yes gene_type:complete
MKEVIELKVKAKSWTFNEISNLSSSIEQLATELYSEMNLIERFGMVKETKINDTMVGSYYPDVLKELCMTHLRAEVAGTIRNMLDKATVNFGGSNNEISESSLGGKPHKERTTDEKKNSSDEE